MDQKNFDHMVKQLTKDLSLSFLELLGEYPEFREDIDTSPLLNLTIGVYMGSSVNILDSIIKQTVGEDKLIKNIELAKTNIIKAVEDLPFIHKVEFF